MKFFVYANKSNVKDPKIRQRALYFVPENKMRDWANKFEPGVMEYCGISIEAEDRDEAKTIFLDPFGSEGFDQMISEDEPLLTKHKTRRFRESEQAIAKATMELMIARLASLWAQVDDMLRALAHCYVLEHNDMTEEEAYQRLKKEWLSKYNEL